MTYSTPSPLCIPQLSRRRACTHTALCMPCCDCQAVPTECCAIMQPFSASFEGWCFCCRRQPGARVVPLARTAWLYFIIMWRITGTVSRCVLRRAGLCEAGAEGYELGCDDVRRDPWGDWLGLFAVVALLLSHDCVPATITWLLSRTACYCMCLRWNVGRAWRCGGVASYPCIYIRHTHQCTAHLSAQGDQGLLFARGLVCKRDIGWQSCLVVYSLLLWRSVCRRVPS